MHFHLPKPLHGWRAFVGEVGIIVLGVLIALGAEQVADGIHWENELRQSDRALQLELGESVGQAVVRIDASPCVEQRLDRLAAIVDEAAATHELGAVSRVPQPQYFTWPSGNYQSMVKGEIANRQPRERLQALSGVYDFISGLNEEQRREVDVWTRVYALVGPGRAFDAEDAREARSAIAEGRILDRMIALRALRLMQLLKAYSIVVDRPSVELYTKSGLHAEVPGRCKPWGEAEAHYGEAPLKDVIGRARATPLSAPRGEGKREG